jgi:hypothetical protein
MNHKVLVICSALVLVGSRGVPGEKNAGKDERAVLAEFVRVDLGEATPLSQGNTQGCGPVSLLNLLKLGPEAYRKAYAKICEGDDAHALELLAKKYCSPKGSDGKARYSDRNGIDDPNLTRLCEEVAEAYQLDPLNTLYTNRKENEASPDFAKRVNEALCFSLARGVPVIMSIDSYGVRDGNWQKLTGHYMLFTGAQRIGKANPSSFLVEYVNPAGGMQRQAFVHAGRRKHPGAYAHFKEGDQWLKDDPYLCISSPYTNLRQSDVENESRHEYFLTVLFGRFGK